MLCDRMNGFAKHRMLSRLTKTGRWKAGWCIALVYLFCVVAPGLSFAFADGLMSAPCLMEDHGAGMNRGDEVSSPMVSAPMVSAPMVHDMAMMADADAPVNAPQKHQGHAQPRCCGLVTISAMPVGETVLVKPSMLSSRCEMDRCQAIAGNAPPKLYRPPIA
jgi:hypothetical protein